jgi:hypothetical protein
MLFLYQNWKIYACQLFSFWLSLLFPDQKFYQEFEYDFELNVGMTAYGFLWYIFPHTSPYFYFYFFSSCSGTLSTQQVFYGYSLMRLLRFTRT